MHDIAGVVAVAAHASADQCDVLAEGEAVGPQAHEPVALHHLHHPPATLAKLAGAEDHQRGVIGKQAAGRVGFFLRVEDFDAAHARLVAAGVQFTSPPRDELYGRVAVFLDVAGNPWDLLGPRPP